jgi:predicted deacylase
MPPTVSRRILALAGLSVPLIELAGSGDDPLLTVLAGVHGCEYASIAAVRRWAREAGRRELRGRVRVVPVLNTTAFAARSPFVVPEDGKNLNRCFPGRPDGTLADRLAYDAFRLLIAGSDAVVDAHCGDLVEALYPFTLYDAGPAEDKARALAVAYGLPYALRQEPGPQQAVAGSTSAAAAEAGIAAIIAEAGGCGLVEEAAVRLHVAGLDGVLRLLGMADDSPGPASTADASTGPASTADSSAEPEFLDRSVWLHSSQEGWWEPTVRPGDRVAAGQSLGTIGTLDGGDLLETITAPAGGVVMFLTSSPAIARDGLLLGLGVAGGQPPAEH